MARSREARFHYHPSICVDEADDNIRAVSYKPRNWIEHYIHCSGLVGPLCLCAGELDLESTRIGTSSENSNHWRDHFQADRRLLLNLVQSIIRGMPTVRRPAQAVFRRRATPTIRPNTAEKSQSEFAGCNKYPNCKFVKQKPSAFPAPIARKAKWWSADQALNTMVPVAQYDKQIRRT